MVVKKAVAAPAPVVPSAPAKKAAVSPAPVKAEVEVEAKPAKVPKAAKVAAAVAPSAPVPAPVEEAKPVVESVVVENPLDVVFAKLSAATALFKEIQANLKVLQKTYDKMRKVVEKQERKKATARTTPSGFAKPTKISDDLCAFLGVPKGSEMSRTEVTRAINSYVKQMSLYDPNNKRIILPDAKMSKILVMKPGEVLSFFSLQRSIKHHFASSVKA